MPPRKWIDRMLCGLAWTILALSIAAMVVMPE